MKLCELIDFEPKPTGREYRDYSRKAQSVNQDYIGTGAFSTAFDTHSPKRLNQVTKIGRAGNLSGFGAVKQVDNIAEDGYLSYLDEVEKHKKDRNPYFPVIHDLKIMKDSTGKLHYRVNLEKLVPLDSEKIIKNEALMESLCEQMFGYSPAANASYDVDYTDVIERRLRKCYREPQFYSADRHLTGAMAIIASIINRTSDFCYDLHKGNIMWRITGTIPHLVLLDPIA